MLFSDNKSEMPRNFPRGFVNIHEDSPGQIRKVMTGSHVMSPMAFFPAVRAWR